MKPIVVQDQVRLAARRCIALTLAGISYRLFRSLVTVAILTLAVAFLAHVLTYGLLEQATKALAYERLAEHRLLGLWLTRLREPDTPKMVRANLADQDAQRMAEYAAWAGATAGELEEAGRVARRLGEIQQYLEALPAAAAAVLLGDLEAQQMLARLQEPAAFEVFVQRLGQVHLRAPLGETELRELLVQKQPWLEELVGRVVAGQARAIEQVRRGSGGETAGALLAGGAGRLGPLMRTAGYQVEDDTLERLAERARQLEDLQRLKPLLQVPAVRAAISRRLGIEPQKLDVPSVIHWIRSSRRAQWLADELAGQRGSEGLTAERIYELAKLQQAQDRLQSVAGDTPPGRRVSLLDLPKRTQWLVIVSFLVCTIGVVNAMMMSVTERFTEIATMKCLGALDGFLLQMFFYEAVIQGVVGGLAGVVLGMLLAVGRGWLTLGNLVFAAMPWTQLGIGGAVSAVAGVILAAVAALGPAWAAARLPPMEAMRVE